jgi:hypothetical protein
MESTGGGDQMSELKKKNINPLLAAVANFCCLGFLGYFLIGQSKKGIIFLIISLALTLVGTIGATTVFLPFVTGVLYLGIIVMTALDIHSIATAMEQDEAVDENEYRFEILYNFMKTFHKEAVFKKGIE